MRPAKGYKVVRVDNPSTGTPKKVWMPMHVKHNRPVFVAMGEADWYDTKDKAVKATYRYKEG